MEVAVELVTQLAREFLTATLPPEITADELPPLTRKQALKSIRELVGYRGNGGADAVSGEESAAGAGAETDPRRGGAE